MAYNFDGSEGFQLDAAAVAGPPFSLFSRFRSASATAAQWPLSLSHLTNSNSFHGIRVSGDIGGDPILASSRDGGAGVASATSTSGYTANQWHAALGVWASTTSRTIYLDGGSSATNTTSKNPSLNETSIGLVEGNFGRAEHFDGDLAELAIWDVALSAAEAPALNLWSPEFVRPGNLVWYWDAIRGTVVNRGIAIGTTIGTPTIVRHPPVIYRPRTTRQGAIVAIAGGGGFTSPLTLQGVG